MEVDGRRAAVKEELDSLCALLEECGATDILRADTEEEAEAVWQLRREFSYSLKATGMTKLNEDIVIPRSRLVELVEFCEAMHRETGLDIACFGHSGDGNIHTNIMVDDYADPEKKGLGGTPAWTGCSTGGWPAEAPSPENTASACESQMVPGSRGGRRLPPARTRQNRPGPGKFAQSGKNGTSVA